jgi:hypothetical protein
MAPRGAWQPVTALIGRSGPIYGTWGGVAACNGSHPQEWTKYGTSGVVAACNGSRPQEWTKYGTSGDL